MHVASNPTSLTVLVESLFYQPLFILSSQERVLLEFADSCISMDVDGERSGLPFLLSVDLHIDIVSSLLDLDKPVDALMVPFHIL